MQTQTRRYTTSTVCSRSIQIHACILLCTSSWGFIFVSALTFSLSEMSVFFFFLNNECMLDMFILFSLIIHDACEKGQLHQIIWSSLSCMTCFDLHNQDQKTFMLKLFAQLCSTLQVGVWLFFYSFLNSCQAYMELPFMEQIQNKPFFPHCGFPLHICFCP